MIKLNKSPILTSKNYGINDFDFDDDIQPSQTKKFTNIKVKNETKSQITKNLPINNISKELNTETQTKSNFSKEYIFDKDMQNPMILEFDIAKDFALVDNIILNVCENIQARVIIKYSSFETMYHNACLKVYLSENSTLDLAVVSNISQAKASLLSIETEQKNNAKINLQVFDFSSQNAVQNIKANLYGGSSKIDLNSVYFGKKSDRLSLNYLFTLFGKGCDAKMNVFGVLNGNAQKNFIGTIDFKQGAKKSVGLEEEYCMLLSDSAKAKSTPILLSDEEFVDGKHSSSVGRIDEKELFYAMSRGIDKREAHKLFVKAKLNTITKQIFDEDLKNEILYQIERRLENENK